MKKKTKEVKTKKPLQYYLDKCDFSKPLSEEEKQWLNDPPKGKELI